MRRRVASGTCFLAECALRPGTLAVDALIQASVARVYGEPVANDAMLFVGDRDGAIPDGVIQDATLEPVDKIVWMVIKRYATDGGSCSTFPNYAEICRRANIASKTTIVRCVAILRITRWLSLCARVREPCGRFRRNIYALHDEALPLLDALHLDPQYQHFLDASLTHPHNRVRGVAKRALAILEADAVSPREPGSRLDAPSSVMKTVPLQNLQRRSSSSLYIHNKTTTTGGTDSVTPSLDEHGRPLTYPSRFSANQCDLASRHLAAIPAELRQSILDETEGRIRAECRGVPAVYDDQRFLSSLCRAALRGEFQINLALPVQDERVARAAERHLDSAATEDSPRDRAAVNTTALASLAEARAVLGMPDLQPGHTGSKPEP